MSKREWMFYSGRSTSGTPVVDDSTTPGTNLAGIIKNNTVVFQGRVTEACTLYRRPEATMRPLHIGRVLEPFSVEEVEASLQQHLDRFDSVFRRLT